MELSEKLRLSGFIVEKDIMERSFNSQMKYADKLGVKYVVVVGEDEVKNNQITLKDMFTKECKTMSISDLVEKGF